MEDMEFIALDCPYCRTSMDFLSYFAGTAQSCPNCCQAIVVPLDGSEIAKKFPLPLKGANLELRRLSPDDWKALLEYWEGVDDLSISNWLKEQESIQLSQEGQVLCIGIAFQTTIIGNFNLSFMDRTHLQIRFDVQINERKLLDHHFREAMLLLYALCFSGLNQHRIVIQINDNDLPLMNRLKLAGMRQEGHFKKDHMDQNGWRDSFFLAMLWDEFNETLKTN